MSGPMSAYDFERRRMQIQLSSAIKKSDKGSQKRGIAKVPLHLAASATRLGLGSQLGIRSFGLPPNGAKRRSAIGGRDLLGKRDTAKTKKEWYFLKPSNSTNPSKIGPFTRNELVLHKNVDGETKVYRRGMRKPRRLDEVREARNFLSTKQKAKREGRNLNLARSAGCKIMESDFLAGDFAHTANLYRWGKWRERTSCRSLAIVHRGRPSSSYSEVTSLLARHQCHRMKHLDKEELLKVEQVEKNGKLDQIDLVIFQKAGVNLASLTEDIEEVRLKAREAAAAAKKQKYEKSFLGRMNKLRVSIIGEKKTLEEIKAEKKAKLLKKKMKRKRKRRIQRGKPPDVQPGEIDTDDSDLSEGELKSLRKKRAQQNAERLAAKKKRQLKRQKRKEEKRKKKEWEEWQKLQQSQQYNNSYGATSYTWAQQSQQYNNQYGATSYDNEYRNGLPGYEGKRSGNVQYSQPYNNEYRSGLPGYEGKQYELNNYYASDYSGNGNAILSASQQWNVDTDAAEKY